MSVAQPVLALCTLTLALGCTRPDASREVAAFGTATGALAAAVSDRFDAQIKAEVAARLTTAIAADQVIYGLTPGCSAILADIAVQQNDAPRADVTGCHVLNRLDRDRDKTRTELAQILALRIAQYGVALADLSKSTLPADIEASSAGVFAAVSGLSAAVDGTPADLDPAAQIIPAVTGFASRQAKARLLRKTVQQAAEPVDSAVSSLIAVLVAQGRDPLFPAIEALQQAEIAMRDAAGSRSYGAQVAAFETARKAYEAAYSTSPSVALEQIRITHASLAKRLSRPATLEEFQTLIAELQALRNLIQS